MNLDNMARRDLANVLWTTFQTLEPKHIDVLFFRGTLQVRVNLKEELTADDLLGMRVTGKDRYEEVQPKHRQT